MLAAFNSGGVPNPYMASDMGLAWAMLSSRTLADHNLLNARSV